MIHVDVDQKDYNEELTNLHKKLEEENNLIDERNFELRETKELLVEKKSEEVGANGNRKLEKELAKSLRLNENLRNELRTQVTITKQTVLAFNTQTELVETKEELIKNQRIVIEHMKRAQEENTNLIDATSNETEHPSVPGLQEKCSLYDEFSITWRYTEWVSCLGRYTKTHNC